ncbi:hypothetical protein BWQ96_05654 [Gracilariopsis chorda]|uniref:ATPase of the ABC class n=1 Tax=Gracilariopsis chorda TaxID=448386 RepID=A0A2V3IS56_9FLOR|nr:hypothetical protein BWQ96_05654 [Gracilariopsis chorda]|eukprot:PXF44577.1 hypothetical protein BWQ96_05654 [Gracilariopsis chorda]
MRFRGRRGRGRGHRHGYSHGRDEFNNHVSMRAPSGEFRGDASALQAHVNSINRAPYPAYKQLLGMWQLLPNITLHIDRIQADPYAPPSRARATVPLAATNFSATCYSNQIRTTAFCDFLVRKFVRQLSHVQIISKKGGWASLKGGDITIDRPSQHVLQRSSCLIRDNQLEIRFCIGLPARGRSIDSAAAAYLLFELLPSVLMPVVFADSSDEQDLEHHIKSVEQQNALREILSENDLIAFVANGAILPRLSGASDTPLAGGGVIKFVSPPSLELSLTLPDGTVVTGMGIKPGVSLIVGGGFHGKSTLLSALQVGVYDHIPGDGREFVVINDKAMYIRAEDGRCVTGVDISPFINNLPFGKSTNQFSTPDASGSTSQAANIIEALEAGAKVLLIDEDLAATNFMIRDQRMQQLVPDAKEPITPMIRRIRTLYEQEGVSTILVVGAAGDYFDVSDLVIMMDSYVPRDVTSTAKDIAKKNSHTCNLGPALPNIFKGRKKRRVSNASLRTLVKGKKVQVKVHTGIHFGHNELDLSAVSQIVEKSQTRAIAAMLERVSEMSKAEEDITSIIKQLESDIDESGMDTINVHGTRLGNYARPRGLEVQAALNRIRGITLLPHHGEKT